MCEIYGFCGNAPTLLNKYTNEFWKHSSIHKDGFGYYLADQNDFYINQNAAYNYLNDLSNKKFISSLALCHIRFKTHGPATIENCHPFIKTDSRGIKWSLVHNGYISDNAATAALGTLQVGETDSERILLRIVESINHLYEYFYSENTKEFLQYLYLQIETTLQELSQLGKTNLIFTDNFTNNMYVFMNSQSLYFLKNINGYHISTTPLSNENWKTVDSNKLHIINNGELI